MTETVPVQFQYSAYNEYSTDGAAGDFFQDHHTLHTSYDNSYDNKTGRSRTTTPSAPAITAMTTAQINPVQVHKNTSRSGPPVHCAHVHKSTILVCKPGESLALRKVKHPHNGRTLVNRLRLTKQDILSHYSGCFESIGCFPGDLYKFHLKPENKPTQHAPRKVPIHLEAAFKEEIKSSETRNSRRSQGTH